MTSTGNFLHTCIGEALATRSNDERSQYHLLFGENTDDGMRRRRRLKEDIGDEFLVDDLDLISNNSSYYHYDDDDNNDDDPWHNRHLHQPHQHYHRIIEKQYTAPKQPLPLLGKDEILQIKIVYGKPPSSCSSSTATGLPCSRVRKVMYPFDREKARLFRSRQYDSSKKNGTNNVGMVGDGTGRFLRGQNIDKSGRQLPANNTANDKQSASNTNHSQGDTTTTPNNEDVDIDVDMDDELSSPEYWQDPSYRFAIDDALLYLDEKSIYLHNISVVNVTLTERCLSTGSDDGT